MYEKLCKKISTKFILHGFITADDMEVFSFGLERILSQIVSFTLLLILGVIYHSILESLMFFFCFWLSRKYAGGYHANTYIKCNTLYLLTFTAALFLSRYFAESQYFYTIIIVTSIMVLITIILFAPINNPNNPILPGWENKFFVFSLLVNIILIIVAFIIQLLNRKLSTFLFTCLFMSTVYMHIEIIRRREWAMMKITKQFGEKMTKLVMKNAKGSVREVSLLNIYQPKRPASLNKENKK